MPVENETEDIDTAANDRAVDDARREVEQIRRTLYETELRLQPARQVLRRAGYLRRSARRPNPVGEPQTLPGIDAG